MSDTLTEGDNIINSLKNYNSNLKSNNFSELDGLFNIPSRNELLNTESFESFLQNGGKTQKIIKGLRYENYLNSDSNSETENTEEMYGGKRNKPSASDEYHQESLNYLKDDLKLSPLESRAYKALAYRFIKENNKESTSLERAKLMLSLIKSENFLQDFKEKLDETMKIIESIDLKKSENSESSEKLKKEKK